MECKINYIIIFYTWNKSCIHIRNEYKVAHVKPEVNLTGKHRGNRKSKLHTDMSKFSLSPLNFDTTEFHCTRYLLMVFYIRERVIV